jgi:DNA adenine methylase
MTKRYFGGKGQPGVYHTIINQMPPHSLYIEAFLGGGSVMRYKKPAARNIGLDLHLPALQQFNQTYLPALQQSEWAELPATAAYETYHANALDFLRYGNIAGQWDQNTLIYLDPPYPLNTRSSNQRYANELTNQQHKELLTIAKQLKCNVMISTYPNQMYQQQLEAWRLVEHKSVASNGEVRTEHLYCNFAQPQYLHDDRYIGDNNDKRMDITRRIDRNKRKIMEWPEVERLRFLKELQREIPDFEKEYLCNFARTGQ